MKQFHDIIKAHYAGEVGEVKKLYSELYADNQKRFIDWCETNGLDTHFGVLETILTAKEFKEINK